MPALNVAWLPHPVLVGTEGLDEANVHLDDLTGTRPDTKRRET